MLLNELKNIIFDFAYGDKKFWKSTFNKVLNAITKINNEVQNCKICEDTIVTYPIVIQNLVEYIMLYEMD